MIRCRYDPSNPTNVIVLNSKGHLERLERFSGRVESRVCCSRQVFKTEISGKRNGSKILGSVCGLNKDHHIVIVEAIGNAEMHSAGKALVAIW